MQISYLTGLFKNDLHKLHRMQNRCLKICLRTDRRTETDLIHSVTKSPKLKFRYKKKVHLRHHMYTKLKDY